jgi:NADH-quinone oxidoreductase subunit G
VENVVDKDGPQVLACAGSSRNNLETLAMIKRVSQTKNWQPPAYVGDAATLQKVKFAISRLEPDLMVSLREIESADFIAVLGADPLNEAPMLALAMRQAQRKGATVAVFDPRPIFLPFEFKHLPANLSTIDADLGAVIKAAIDPATIKKRGGSAHEFYGSLTTAEKIPAARQAEIVALAEKLRASQRPLIVCGTETVRRQTPALAADFVLLIQAVGKSAGLFYLMPGANGFAAGLLADENVSFETLISAIEQGSIKGLILVESNPLWQFPDRQRLVQALEQLELLVVMDYVNSELAQKADIFLPTTTLYETGGVYVNQEGRAQAVGPAYRGGIPIAQAGDGDHPPRVYGTGIPGAEPQAAWQALASLMETGQQMTAENLRADIWQWLAKTESGFEALPGIAKIPPEGARFFQAPHPAERLAPVRPNGGPHSDGQLEVMAVERIFGTEELSAYSACLTELASTPGIFINAMDAKQLNLTDGDLVSIELNSGAVEARLQVAANMAAGTLVIPRHKDLDWQKMGTGQTWVRKDQIQKLG